MSNPKIVAFAGSSRAGSWNLKLLTLATAAVRAAGGEVEEIDLRALDLPLFDQDLEAATGLPAGARDLKRRLRESDGFLIVSPEYNSSITPLLKNAIDWASRAETDDEPPLAAYQGKTAALFSASPGALGGLRGLVHVRAILGNIGVLVLPAQVCVAKAHEAFDSDGKLVHAHQQKQVSELATSLVETARKLSN